MKNVIILILVQLSLLSCSENEKLGYKKLDLEKFDFNKKIDNYFSAKKFLQKDTFELDYDSTKIVTTYMTIGDSLSFYGKTFFDGIYVMKDNKDGLIALNTFFKHTDINPLKEFINYLCKKHGNPNIVKHNNLDHEYTSSYWQLEDRLIVVNSIYDTEVYKKMLTSSKHDAMTFMTRLFIVKKESQNEIVGKIHRGEWMDLDLDLPVK